MKFDVLVTTEIGLENLVKKDLEEEFKFNVIEKPFNLNGRLLIKNLSLEEIFKLVYCGRSIHRVILLLKTFEITKDWKLDEKIYYKEAKDLDLSFLFKSFKTFGVTSSKIGENFNYTSIDIRKPIGKAILENYNTKVYLNDPDVLIRVDVINNIALLGIDLVGKALYKRGWRVYYSNASIKSTTAYLMIKLSEWNENKKLLDPFTCSGTIPIEAATYAKNYCPGRYRNDLLMLRLDIFREIYENFKDNEKDVKLNIYAYDINPNEIVNAKKNARMAKVYNDIKFGVLDVKYLFTKFDKEIDSIVTNPPWGIRLKMKKLGKIYYYLFDNAVDILKDDGYLVLVTPRATLVRKLCEHYNFKILEEYKVFINNTHFHLFKIW